MMNVELTDWQVQMLDDCTVRLGLARDEVLARAIARLHCALFQNDEGLDDIDYGKSLDLTGQESEVVQCIFEVARAYKDDEGSLMKWINELVAGAREGIRDGLRDARTLPRDYFAPFIWACKLLRAGLSRLLTRLFR